MTDPSRSWAANSVRIVLFPSARATGLDVWRGLFAVEPDIEEVRPREGLKRQGGPFRGGQLEIVTTPIRIDIVLGPRIPEVQASPMPSMALSVGDFAEELDALTTAVRDWLPRCEVGLQRLAVTGVALLPTESVEGSYGLLAERLKSVRVVPGVMRDLNYRVNWRVKSRLQDVGFYNRITAWSALMFGVQAQTAPGAPTKDLLAEHYACLELDHSTPAERVAPLVADELVAILNDLVYLALQNLEHGECPTDA